MLIARVQRVYMIHANSSPEEVEKFVAEKWAENGKHFPIFTFNGPFMESGKIAFKLPDQLLLSGQVPAIVVT